MLMNEAKCFVGCVVDLVYRDRKGEEVKKEAEVFDVGFVPLYGPCLITDLGDIRLDRITRCEPALLAKAA